MAMEYHELDDDVFFADISKQINLLITDEDELNPISLSSSVSFQGLFRESYQTSSTPYMMMYNEQNCNQVIRESKGTGVFIPRCSHQPRRRQHNNNQKKQGRLSSFIPKQQFPNHVYDNNNNNYTTLNNNNNNQESITLHNHASTNARRTYRDAASLFT